MKEPIDYDVTLGNQEINNSRAELEVYVKPWFLSKGIIGGVTAMLIPIVTTATASVSPEMVTQGVQLVANGLAGFFGLMAAYGRYHADTPVKAT